MQRKQSNWSETEKIFDQLRDLFLEEVDLKGYMDHPFLFSKRQRVAYFLTRIELFKKVLDVQGSIVECGVHKGSSLMLFYHLSSILEPYAFTRKIIGFDTFCGFRSITKKESATLDEEMFSDTSYEILKKAVELNDMNRVGAHIPKCDIVKGDAVITIPKYKQENPELIIAMLYLDFDLYEPTIVALKEFLPLVPKGGIVVFDELNIKKFAGETAALKEYFDLNKIKLQKFYFDPWPSYFIVGE